MTVTSQWESEWPVGRLKNVLAVPVTDGPHSTPEFIAEGIPFLSVDAIQEGELVFTGCRYVSFEDHVNFVRKARPRINDLLMGKAASTGKIARVKTSAEFSIWSPLALIRIDENLADPGFIEYCLKSPECQFEIDGYSNANTQKNIGMGDIPRISLPLPDLETQAETARFLDRETAQIDDLIGKQERLIALLAEKRQAIITHAVSKGLDPAAPIKPSGIPWVGDIPAKWSVQRVSWLFSTIASGTTPPSEKQEYYEGDTNWVTTGELREKPIFKTLKKVSSIALTEFPTLRLYPPGTLLMAMYGATIGRLGILSEPATTNQACCAFSQPTRAVSKFVFYAMIAAKEHLLVIASGGGQPNINQEKIRALRLPVPEITEQISIVGWLEKRLSKLDGLTLRSQETIGLLKERRSALISAAVTGKIDVRERAA